MEWTLGELCAWESEALAKHILAFVFVLLYFSRWFPRKKRSINSFRTEFEKNRVLLICDIVFGVLFISLLVVSTILLLSPQNVLSEKVSATAPVALRGEVSDQWLRPYLLAPSSAGSYVIIGTKQLYIPQIKTSMIGMSSELMYLPKFGYAVRFESALSSTTELHYPWYLYAGRWFALLSGLYLAVRLGITIFKEGIAEKKQRDKTNPIAQFLDRL